MWSRDLDKGGKLWHPWTLNLLLLEEEVKEFMRKEDLGREEVGPTSSLTGVESGDNRDVAMSDCIASPRFLFFD